ncbi:MAG TPA: hypothetical protein PLY40_07805 [Bacillota bacterium]|nr:hypothetical protein [Bacillota bacterium]
MRKKLKWLIPAIIAPENPPGEEELVHLCDEIEDYLNYNKNFKLIYSLCLGLVNTMPLFTKGRTLRLLKPETRQEFLNKLLRSRFSLARGVSTLAGLPIKMVYYNQEAEQARLGFDARALKEEAGLRLVSRSGTQAS